MLLLLSSTFSIKCWHSQLSLTEKDWDDIKFGVDNEIDFYAVSFVKDASVVHELKNYLKGTNSIRASAYEYRLYVWRN